jgi:DNA-binding IclR family transcriptional regulator
MEDFVPNMEIEVGSPAVLMALSILESFAASGRRLTLSELCRMAGVPKATAFRILAALESRGFVARDPSDKSYALGARLWQIAQVALPSAGLLRIARPILEDMAGWSGETAHVGVLEGSHIVYADIAESPQRVRAHVTRGERLPAHSTASGKVILAFADAPQVDQVLGPHPERKTARTITEHQRFRDELAFARVEAMAFAFGEGIEDITAVSSPVFDASGAAIGAIGISGPALRFDEHRARAAAPRIRSAAERLSAQLGHSPHKTGSNDRNSGTKPPPAARRKQSA